MDRVRHPERSSYTIDLTIVEGTMNERQPFIVSLVLDVKADRLSQEGTFQHHRLQTRQQHRFAICLGASGDNGRRQTLQMCSKVRYNRYTAVDY